MKLGPIEYWTLAKLYNVQQESSFERNNTIANGKFWIGTDLQIWLSIPIPGLLQPISPKEEQIIIYSALVIDYLTLLPLKAPQKEARE